MDGYPHSRALRTRISSHRFAYSPTNPSNQQGFDCHGEELVQQGSTARRVALAKHPTHSLCQTSVVTKVETILRQNNVYGATFYEIGQHSPIADIRKGIEIFKEHDCDVIVAVGGGSPIDASKAILYNLQKESGGRTLPQIAIPTTLSAAEYTVSWYLSRTRKLLRLRLPRSVQASRTMRAQKLLSVRMRWLQLGSFSMQN